MTWTDPGIILAGDGDWTVNGNDIYNSNSGNVGIGTTTPDAELDVNGELRISELQSHGFTTGSNVIQVKATTDTDQWIRFRRGGNPRGEAGVIFSMFDNDHFFVNNVEDALAFSRSTENSATPDFANSNELMRLAANGNLGIGNNNPGAKLDVAGSIRMQDGNQAAGFIPVSDSNGTMIWTDPGIISGDTLTIIADADGDTKIQVEESADEDVIRFDVAGTEVATLDGNGRLQFFSNNYSVFIGEGAGSIGTDNTYVGNNAAHSVTGGKENTALGSGAMYYKQTGRGNTAIGAWSLLDNVSGHENTAIGSRAGQNATGSGNVFIGYGAGFYASGNNKLYIGNDLYTSLTPLIYGEFDNDLVRVNGSFEAIDNIAINGSYVATIENTANAGWSNGLAIKAGQNTQTVNNRFISFARPDGSEIGAVRQITSNSVDYNTTSDIRLKTNIQPTTKGLTDLMQIEVKDYRYKDDPAKLQTGFIAQQVYEHYPNAVTPGGEDVKTNPWMMDYGKMTPLLVKAVQEQQAQIEELKAQNEALQNKVYEVDALKAQNAEMKAEIESIKTMLEMNNNIVKNQ
jgi:hypothetical protein